MAQTEFKLASDCIELIKLLKFMGIAATGGGAKMLVEAGLVRVNNEPESRKRRKLRKGDTVQIDDTVITIV